MRVYRSSLIKRRRRTNPEIEDIKVAAYELIEADRPMTDRQGFYRLVGEGVIEKTEREYKNTVARRRRRRKIHQPCAVAVKCAVPAYIRRQPTAAPINNYLLYIYIYEITCRRDCIYPKYDQYMGRGRGPNLAAR